MDQEEKGKGKKNKRGIGLIVVGIIFYFTVISFRENGGHILKALKSGVGIIFIILFFIILIFLPGWIFGDKD